MKRLGMLGIIGGAAILTAAPLSLQWSQKHVALSLDSAQAQVGRPPTATSVAGASRRAYRREVYANAAAGLGGYGYYSYSAPSYSSYYAPYSSGYAAPYSSGYAAPYSSGYATPYSYSYAAPYSSGYASPYGYSYAAPYSYYRRPFGFYGGWGFY